MKKLLPFIILIFALATSAQTNNTPKECNLDRGAAPTLRGLKLGMTNSEVSKLLGKPISLFEEKTKVNVNKQQIEVSVGVESFTYSGMGETVENFNGIDYAVLSFYKNELFYIYFSYAQQSVQWKNSSESASFFSEILQLPINYWSVSDNYASVQCSGFTFFISTYSNHSSLIFKDPNISKIIATAAEKLAMKNQLVQPKITPTPIAKRAVTEQQFEPSPLEELSKLELTDEEKKVTPKQLKTLEKAAIKVQGDSGAKPAQAKDGKVQAVMNFINEYFNDPYSVRFVRWSKVEAKSYQNKMYWSVTVKLRAKNTFNAYVLSEITYYIKNNKVVAFEKIY